MIQTTMCPKCGGAHGRTNARYCLLCHAAYMRRWRRTHPLTPAQRFKDNARSYAGVYERRGKLLKPGKCGRCGGPEPQKHHADYTKPLEVEWVCRPCHLAIHKADGIYVEQP